MEKFGVTYMIKMDKAKKLVMIVNTCLMICALLLIIFYVYFGVKYMVYHSIPTVALYVVSYIFIRKEKLALYVKLLYAQILIYLTAATICIGHDSAFQFYCWALVSVTFYIDYLAHVLKTEKIGALRISLYVAAVYLFCTWFTRGHSPIYAVDSKIMTLFMYINIVLVFAFLIVYSNFIHKMIINSEDRLSDLALLDQLTGLFNRRSMIDHLDEIFLNVTPQHWLAMVDIDDFKKFNDTYGHNCGDYVLVEMTNIMKNVCQGCVISRWGGEEFLIATDGVSFQPSMLELFRQAVERTKFSFEGTELHLTVTIGFAYYEPDQSLDKWIQHADDNLYEGKRSGKNKIVF